MHFADMLEKATIGTVEAGEMTKDLALITTMKDVHVCESAEFIQKIRENLESLLA